MESERKLEAENILETRSVVTRSTTTSKRSSRKSASMAAAKARARAEAECTYYVKKTETEMKIEKVRMEGSLTALEHEKEAAAAMAEARILEEAVESMEGGSYRSDTQIAPPIDPVQRTSDYVEQHSSHSIVVPPEESFATPHAEFVSRYECENRQLTESSPRCAPPDCVNMVSDSVPKPNAVTIERPQSATYSPTNYWPLAQTYNASTPVQSPLQGEVEMSDLARFLARRELINSGLTKFDDHPENYWAWKSSFLNATSRLKLTSSEQLDLLIK